MNIVQNFCTFTSFQWALADLRITSHALNILIQAQRSKSNLASCDKKCRSEHCILFSAGVRGSGRVYQHVAVAMNSAKAMSLKMLAGLQ